MNWTQILANAGIPEPPGRQEAVALALQDAKRKRPEMPIIRKSSSKRQVPTVSRKLLQERERKARQNGGS